MTIDVSKDLENEQQSDFHAKMLRECLANIKRSRSKMAQFYPQWDLQDMVFRGEREPDLDDKKQNLEGKPVKMTVPTTRAQIESYVAFLFGLFTQNVTPYELKPIGVSDYGTKWEDCETILDRDCGRSSWNKLLYQFLLDTGRFGIAPLEVVWTKQVVKIWVSPSQPTVKTLDGIPLAGNEPAGYKEFTKFEGNLIRNISPYRFFPDPEFPICDFQKGKFCGSEEDFTMADLRKLEANGEVSGIDFIEPPARNLESFRGAASRLSFGAFPTDWDNKNDCSPVCVTKLRKWIIPKNYELEGKKVLGDETFPVLYNVWYANDNRVIKCSVAEEWHQEFNYAVGQYSYDMHRLLAMGLADLIYPLQDTISWFLNSHITSVRRVIANRNIINPTLVETKSYDAEGDIIMRKGFGRTDPNLAVRQLAAQDVTQGHMNDVDTLTKLAQTVTGVNDNLQGQMNTGRRSAQENRVQTAGAASRLKTQARLLWEGGLGRIGKLMLSNSRQSLSIESFARALGGLDPQKVQDRFLAFQGTPEEIVCGDDYLIFDSTLSSEKGYSAQQLQEMFSIVAQANPFAMQQFASQIDLVKVFDEMQYLRDGTPVERFKYTPQQQQMMQQAQMQAMLAQQAGAQPAQPQPAAA